MNIGIYGLGLMGGSLGRAIVRLTEHTVFGYDIDKQSMTKGVLLQAYHNELTLDNISNMDIVIVALHPEATIEALKKVAPRMKPNSILCDCCGNKRTIVAVMEELRKSYAQLHYISLHPMAGREFSGIAHSTVGLYERASIIAVPIHTDIEPLTIVKQLFMDIKADRFVISSADEHDKIIAYTSQLAHIVSSAYIMCSMSKEHMGFSAGSFKDMTRVAKLNPDMWTELMIDNSDNLSSQISELIDNLTVFKDSLDNKSADVLHSHLENGVKAKEFAESLRKL